MATPFRKKIEIIFSNKRKIKLDLPTVDVVVDVESVDGNDGR